MLEPNKDLSRMFERAINLAIEKNHEYITLEHFLYGMVTDSTFADMLAAYGAPVPELKADLENFINVDLKEIATLTGHDRPKKTNTVERMLNRAFTQVLFSGRQKIEPVDCLISLFSEKNSHAHYFMRKAKIEKDKFLEFISKEPIVVDEKEEAMFKIDNLKKCLFNIVLILAQKLKRKRLIQLLVVKKRSTS